MGIFDNTIKNTLNFYLGKIEMLLESDAIFYYGNIHLVYAKTLRDIIEQLKAENKSNRLSLILNTYGGSAEASEKMVEIIRENYNEVYFIVPDYALSAGTILCMSGDKIFMDYSSSLGPIDPQVDNGKQYVPALGYLDKVDEFIEKSREGKLTQAEFLMLQQLDLGVLRSYEQARDLTISLLKEWLVKYKFKNWDIHRTDSSKKGKPVTIEEKENRAKEIAKLLGNNKIWHSHGRFIGIKTLRSVLKLEIDDYSSNNELRMVIRTYNDIICEYIARHGNNEFFHTRLYF
ncbi:protein of unknown function DUF114 [Candidatus Magnetoovum chiemensis]|nr:protein of unknown function DUF114 [Candidatus Magnetoovum chiemensis]